MKKFYLFALLISFLGLQSFSFVSSPEKTKNQVSSSESSPLAKMSVEEFLNLTHGTYTEMTGLKMNFKDRIALKLFQHKIKRELKKSGNVDLSNYVDEEGLRFNLGGFALGLFFGLVGVAVAHIFSKNKSFRRSSLHGFLVWLIFAITVSIVTLATLGD